MSRGPSGRVVVELEPELKRRLYAQLVREGHTLKEWLVQRASEYLAKRESTTARPRQASSRSRAASQ